MGWWDISPLRLDPTHPFNATTLPAEGREGGWSWTSSQNPHQTKITWEGCVWIESTHYDVNINWMQWRKVIIKEKLLNIFKNFWMRRLWSLKHWLQCDLPAKASTCRFLHFLPASLFFASILPISPNLPFLLRLNMSAGHQVRNISENYRIFSDFATVNNFAHKMQGWVERVRALVELAC